jgi:hypothetical protein
MRARLGRVLCALCLAALSWSGFSSAAGATSPRAVIAVFETARLSLPQGPLPNGLRFVLYDDGQVITRSGPTQAEPDPAGRGVVAGRLDRDAAEALRKATLADLEAVAKPESGLAAAAEVGSTVLEVWDGEGYRRFSAHAWPCQAEGRVFTGGWQRNREQTDPAFRAVCDRLLQYKIGAPMPFAPKTVKLMLGAIEDAPERQVPWPKEWPAAPADLKPKSAIAFCAPVSEDPASFSHQLIAARWDETGRTALVVDAQTSAVLWDWYFDLPAPIPLLNEKGEPDGTVGNACP